MTDPRYPGPGQPYGNNPYGNQPPRKSNGGKIAAIIIGVVVLVGALSAVGLYALTKKSNNNVASPGSSTGTHASTGTSSGPTAAAPTTPAVRNTDSVYAKV